VAVFFGLSYLIAWSVFGVMWLVAREAGGVGLAVFWARVEGLRFEELPDGLAVSPWALYALTRLADFSFTLAGLAVIGVTMGGKGLVELGRRLVDFRFAAKWYGFACLPLLFYVVAALVAAAGDGELGRRVAFGPATWGAVLFGAHSGILVHLFLRGALGEEPGLRGYALPALQSHYGAARASLIIGVLWGVWHLPVLMGRDAVRVVLFLVLAVLLSFVFTWLFNGSGGSLVPGLIFHALQNAEEAVEAVVPGLVGTDWETVSSLALVVFGVFIAMRVAQGRRGAG